MATYLRLKCTTCKRTTDRKIDNFRYVTDKCTITLQCTGRLQPVLEHNNPTVTMKPMLGVKDWYARDLSTDYSIQKTIHPVSEPEKIFSVNGASNVDLINTVTGYDGQVVFAVRAKSDEFTMPDELSVSFEIADDSPRTFKAYVYRLTSSRDSIDGKESGVDGKILRYNTSGSSPDVVEVRVNGVLRLQGDGPDDYKLNVIPNGVKFNRPIPVSTKAQVDVIVMKQTQPTIVTVLFQRTVGSSNTANGAFENIQTVSRFENGSYEPYTVYTVNIGQSGIPINSIVAPLQVQATSYVIDFASGFFLLAREPYLPLDRYSSALIPFNRLSIEHDLTMKVFVDSSTKQVAASTSKDALSVVYPPLVFGVINDEKPYNRLSAGVTDQVTFDGGIIVGPDK